MPNVGQLIHSTFECTDALYQKFIEAKEDLQIEDVWYSPQYLVPRYPCIILEPRPKRRQFSGTHRWEITFQVAVLLYHGRVIDSETQHRENELQANIVEEFIHQDLTLGGRVVFGFVSMAEPGLVNRGEYFVSATRLLWTGESREEF